jgi:hypothetical protein
VEDITKLNQWQTCKYFIFYLCLLLPRVASPWWKLELLLLFRSHCREGKGALGCSLMAAAGSAQKPGRGGGLRPAGRPAPASSTQLQQLAAHGDGREGGLPQEREAGAAGSEQGDVQLRGGVSDDGVELWWLEKRRSSLFQWRCSSEKLTGDKETSGERSTGDGFEKSNTPRRIERRGLPGGGDGFRRDERDARRSSPERRNGRPSDTGSDAERGKKY